jgi:hypothetical protein
MHRRRVYSPAGEKKLGNPGAGSDNDLREKLNLTWIKKR